MQRLLKVRGDMLHLFLLFYLLWFQRFLLDGVYMGRRLHAMERSFPWGYLYYALPNNLLEENPSLCSG